MTKMRERVTVLAFALAVLGLHRRLRVRDWLLGGKAALVILAATTTNDDLLGGVNDFFDSGAWMVIRNLAIFFVAVFWLATAYWVYKDARRRVEDPWLVGDGDRPRPRPAVHRPDHLSFFRPPEYIEDVRERELEIRAMEDRLVQARPALPRLPGRGRGDVPRLPGLHDPAEAGVREVQQPARGALADLPALRDAGLGAEPARGRRGHDRRLLDCSPQARSGRRVRSAAVAVERTLILIKPDATERALAGEILARIERRGFTVVGGKLLRVSRDLGSEHYAEHSEKPFYGELVDFITSAPTWALVVEGEGAIATMRKTIGATNPADAEAGHDPRRPRDVDAEQPDPRLRFARVCAARDLALVRRR